MHKAICFKDRRDDTECLCDVCIILKGCYYRTLLSIPFFIYSARTVRVRTMCVCVRLCAACLYEFLWKRQEMNDCYYQFNEYIVTQKHIKNRLMRILYPPTQTHTHKQ